MRPPIAVVVGATLFSLGCGLVFRQSHDYVFGVAVIVRDGQNVPIPGAGVSLALAEPVFQAVTPVSAAEKLTDEVGGCVFMYIAGRRSVPYSLTVRKDHPIRGIRRLCIRTITATWSTRKEGMGAGSTSGLGVCPTKPSPRSCVQSIP